ncbi:MAG: OmpH family outer membrane protein [Desulfovibrionaceae bacterium]|nr:OmpH family outer membrane protein [Desulfovibrionaceae bacterium]
MKRVCLLSVCFVFLLQAVAYAETKIAVFDLQEMVEESQYGKEIKAKMDAKFMSRGQQLNKERDSLANLKKQIDSKAFDEKTLQDKVMEFRRRARDLNEDFAVFQKSIKAEQAKLIAPITPVAQKVIKDFCVAKGYTLAFDKQTPGLTFIADGLDVTAELVKALDAAKKAGK